MLYILSIKKKIFIILMKICDYNCCSSYYFKEMIFQLQGSYVKMFLGFFLYYSQHNKHYGLKYICK